MNAHRVIVAGGGVAGLEASSRSTPRRASASRSPCSSPRSSSSTGRCSSPGRSPPGMPSTRRSRGSSAPTGATIAANRSRGRPRGPDGDHRHRRRAVLRLARARARRPAGSRLRARHDVLPRRRGRALRPAARPRGGLQLERRLRHPTRPGVAVPGLRARAAHRTGGARDGRRTYASCRHARAAPAGGVRRGGVRGGRGTLRDHGVKLVTGAGTDLDALGAERIVALPRLEGQADRRRPAGRARLPRRRRQLRRARASPASMPPATARTSP